MVSDRLKEIIFKKLYKDLSCVEIIPYKDELWFIDRENKCWYFIFCSNGTLWWKYGFFRTFFELFSLTDKEFTPVISSWVEEVLNCKVNTTLFHFAQDLGKVEEVLNCKVNTTNHMNCSLPKKVEEVLNCKVNTTTSIAACLSTRVEEVLNCKVNTTNHMNCSLPKKVEEVLNCKVNTTYPLPFIIITRVEEVLNCKVNTTIKWMGHPTINVNEVLRGNDITQ